MRQMAVDSRQPSVTETVTEVSCKPTCAHLLSRSVTFTPSLHWQVCYHSCSRAIIHQKAPGAFVGNVLAWLPSPGPSGFQSHNHKQDPSQNIERKLRLLSRSQWSCWLGLGRPPTPSCPPHRWLGGSTAWKLHWSLRETEHDPVNPRYTISITSVNKINAAVLYNVNRNFALRGTHQSKILSWASALLLLRSPGKRKREKRSLNRAKATRGGQNKKRDEEKITRMRTAVATKGEEIKWGKVEERWVSWTRGKGGAREQENYKTFH